MTRLVLLGAVCAALCAALVQHRSPTAEELPPSAVVASGETRLAPQRPPPRLPTYTLRAAPPVPSPAAARTADDEVVEAALGALLAPWDDEYQAARADAVYAADIEPLLELELDVDQLGELVRAHEEFKERAAAPVGIEPSEWSAHVAVVEAAGRDLEQAQLRVISSDQLARVRAERARRHQRIHEAFEKPALDRAQQQQQ